MAIYETITPTKPITFEHDNDAEAAAVLILFSRGEHGIKQRGGYFNLPPIAHCPNCFGDMFKVTVYDILAKMHNDDILMIMLSMRYFNGLPVFRSLKEASEHQTRNFDYIKSLQYFEL